jgi:hypothetical protein
MTKTRAELLTELREIAERAQQEGKRCALHPEDVLDLIDLAEAGLTSKPPLPQPSHRGSDSQSK